MTELLRRVITVLLQNRHFSVKKLKYLMQGRQLMYCEYAL